MAWLEESLQDLGKYLDYLIDQTENGPMASIPQMREHASNLRRYRAAVSHAVLGESASSIPEVKMPNVMVSGEP